MIGLKLSFALAVLIGGVLGGALPLQRGSRVATGRLFGLGNAFAAGVFLGAGLVHMLPDAHEAWRSLGWEYPMAFFLAAMAFALMLLFEHVLLPESAHEMVHAPSDERFAHTHGGDRYRSGMGAYAVLTVLSIHSFLAGLALGAQPQVASAVVIFVAIVAHKSTAGFALGVSLTRGQIPKTRAWALLGLFSIATPIGILVGALLDASLQGPDQRVFEATFLALAGGTFAYVATLDILRDELQEPGRRFSKWLCVVAGLLVMGVLALWI